MDKIFLYWDNSNIFISAQDVAAEREGWGARSRVRIHFPAMVKLACRQRPIGRALAVGSVPPTWPALGRTPSAAAIACAGFLIPTPSVTQDPGQKTARYESCRPCCDGANHDALHAIGMASQVALPNGPDALGHTYQGIKAKPMKPTPSPWRVKCVNQEGG